MFDYDKFAAALVSPSARKVWIEIGMVWDDQRYGKSPSARKVWIEITQKFPFKNKRGVTFRKEGVD